MSNIRFHGSNESETNDYSIECFVNSRNEITINCHHVGELVYHFSFDICTASQFRKRLAQQIAKAKEVNHG